MHSFHLGNTLFPDSCDDLRDNDCAARVAPEAMDTDHLAANLSIGADYMVIVMSKRSYKKESMDIDFALRNFFLDGDLIVSVCGYEIKESHSGGYKQVRFMGRKSSYHRIVFWLYYRYDPEAIDHIDRDKMNNHPLNLRGASVSENNRNVGVRKNNTSGFKGVVWMSSVGKWSAKIMKDRKIRYLGCFTSKIDAAKAYDKEAVILHGDYAVTNKSLGLY